MQLLFMDTTELNHLFIITCVLYAMITIGGRILPTLGLSNMQTSILTEPFLCVCL